MSNIKISLWEHTLNSGQAFTCDQADCAVWLAKGSIQSGDQVYNEGDGFYWHGSEIVAKSDCDILQVGIGEIREIPASKLLLQSEFTWPEGEAILRLDRVSFPLGAIAYRHVHAGAGIRYLTLGSLEIVADNHSDQMTQGSSWFEDVNSAVRANASQTEETQFIRAMVLPLEYEGKSTIRFLNQEDFDKPKLQLNHRFFDQRINIKS